MIERTAALLLMTALLLARPAAAEERDPSRGETVYVPVYSHIHHGNLDNDNQPARLLMSSMLSIRNVDPHFPITVRSVRYFDTEGKLLREYYPRPVKLGALASADVLIEHRDQAGGAGANFLVVWSADAPITPPIIESINSYFFGCQSGVFASRGVALRGGG